MRVYTTTVVVGVGKKCAAASDLIPATVKHLLAVEDDAEIANLLQRYFEGQNFRSVRAAGYIFVARVQRT